MANVNYVRFVRGSKTAWANVTVKDPDTLYFIYENKDSDSGVLYLGDKLILGGESSGGGSTSQNYSLSQLKDVLLANGISDNSLLVFDGGTGKWVNKPASEVLSIMVGATAEKAGASGLVPVPQTGDQDKFLRGDGKWTKVVGSLSDEQLNEFNGLKKTVSTLVGKDTNKSVQQIATDVITSWAQSNPTDVVGLNDRLVKVENVLFDGVTDPGLGTIKTGLITTVGNLSERMIDIQKDVYDINDKLKWHEMNETTK